MPTKKTATHEVRADRGQNLTLAEIATFVADAREAGVPSEAVPVALTRMSGKVYKLTVKGGDLTS